MSIDEMRHCEFLEKFVFQSDMSLYIKQKKLAFKEHRPRKLSEIRTLTGKVEVNQQKHSIGFCVDYPKYIDKQEKLYNR
jgi:hypothetical protein